MGCRKCPQNKRVTRITVTKTRRVVMQIEGMNCEHCVMMVRSILEGAGIYRDIQVEFGRASFQAPRNRSLDDVREAIEALGYRIEKIL